MTQDELKALVGQAALQYVTPGEIVGVGTGSTVNKFIDALASMKDQIKGAVSSSVASTERLQALGIPVFEANEVGELSVYIDGADEIDARATWSRAAVRRSRAKRSWRRSRAASSASPTNPRWSRCWAPFPLPVEVIPMASAARMARQFAALGGRPGAPEGRRTAGDRQRPAHPGRDRPADRRPAGLRDDMVNQWPGVVTVGVFAHQKASVCLLGTDPRRGPCPGAAAARRLGSAAPAKRLERFHGRAAAAGFQ
jgi:ribose 5-phosphate isomerase A